MVTLGLSQRRGGSDTGQANMLEDVPSGQGLGTAGWNPVNDDSGCAKLVSVTSGHSQCCQSTCLWRGSAPSTFLI